MLATCNALPLKKCIISSQWNIYNTRDGTQYCRDCPDCPSGYELYPPCGNNISADTETGCRSCINGKTFSNTKDSAPCKPCNICGKNKGLLQQCELEQNRICGKCLKGFYPTTSGDCLPCHTCCNSSKENDKHEKCIRDGEKHCIGNPKCNLPIIETPTNSSNFTLENNGTSRSGNPNNPDKTIIVSSAVLGVCSIIILIVGVLVYINKCNRKQLPRCTIIYASVTSLTTYPVEEKQKSSGK